MPPLMLPKPQMMTSRSRKQAAMQRLRKSRRLFGNGKKSTIIKHFGSEKRKISMMMTTLTSTRASANNQILQ
jgi:hypothetical protein